MKTRSKIILICFLFGASVLTSCIKRDEFPIIPAIQWEGYSVMQNAAGNDSLGFLKISYTDGDGNIGLYDWDTVEPYKYNFYVKMFQMKNDSLQEIIFPDSNINFNARIPILTPTGKNKNIKGEIEMLIELYYASPILKSDTIAFKLYIQDRDLNKSNVIETPLLPFIHP
ncbi:MAG: hypothetical protein ACOYMF_14100 [Bacteroidales bacterium]